LIGSNHHQQLRYLHYQKKQSVAMDIEDLHRQACENKSRFYIDPQTGYNVFTAYAHKQRGKCCGSACRHCPFGHENVSMDKFKLARAPQLLRYSTFKSDAHSPHDEVKDGDGGFDNAFVPAAEIGKEVDVIFWSGGKDSFMAYLVTKRALKGEKGDQARGIILLNTFSGQTGIVAHQEVNVTEIMTQAKTLKRDLLLVPLFSSVPYHESVQQGLKLVQYKFAIKRLIFGDLHLETIRSWREDIFAKLISEGGFSFELDFPLWKIPYDELKKLLFSSGAKVVISAVSEERATEKNLKVGMVYNEQFIANLPSDCDQFGENGEFHTLVAIPQDL